MPRESTVSRAKQDGQDKSMARPQGAPRGMLMFYMLHRIALKPSHGYELLQDIDKITEGAWRPGAGSIYPMLKKLAGKGYIKCESGGKGETTQCVYSITPKGQEFLKKARGHLKGAGQRWGSMSRVFLEFIEPEDMPAMLIDVTKHHFGVAEEALRLMEGRLPLTEMQYVLKGYVLILERQLSLSNKMLGDLEAKKGS